MEKGQVKYLNERQVSVLTGLAVQTLRNHRSRHIGLPYLKIGKCVRYDWQDVIDYMSSCRIQTERI